MHRAYSVIVAKSLDEDLRVLEGWATTPTIDRTGDIVVSSGVKAAQNIPLLLNHSHAQPVGRAFLGRATAKGLPFRATIPKVDEPGILKDRTDEAWHSVKHGLITAVSIGFRTVEGAVERLASGGRKYLQCEVFELSLVPIPANSEAVITAVKKLDRERSGPTSRVVYFDQSPHRRPAPARAGRVVLY